MVPPTPFVPQPAGISAAVAGQDEDSERAMSMMVAAATALLPASQRRRRSSALLDSAPEARDPPQKSPSPHGTKNPTSNGAPGTEHVDTVALAHIYELLLVLRNEVLAPRFLRHVIAVAWIAALSAIFNMKRYELQAELFGLLLLGSFDVGRAGKRPQQFGARFQAMLFFEALGVALDSGISLLTSSLAIPWQDRMTRALHEAYFSELTYYHARDLVSHERIGKDVPAFAHEIASITCNGISVLVRFFVFGMQLARHELLTPVRWWLPAACAAPGLTAVIALVQRRWPRVQALQRQQRSVEAALRRQHDRLRRHSDAVAMCCGEALEAAAISKRMAALRRHGGRTLVATCAFDVGKGLAVRYGPHAVLMAVTLYTAKAGSSLRAVRDLLHGSGLEAAIRLAQSLRLLWDVLAHQLQTALQFMRVTQSSPHLFVLAARLGSFALDLRWRHGWQRSWDKSAVITDSPGFVRLKDVTACTPGGRVIVEQLNLRVDVGQHLLVHGPLGSGKTALARCLGSLWPAPVGSMALPGGQALGLARPGCLYLSERPALGRGPTLQHQLALPCFPGQHVRELDSTEVTRLLHLVGLGGSADGEGLTLGSCSLADQQRLGMAQLLYYRPTFAILDACTSALPPAEEAELLRACSEAHITMIALMDVPRLQGHVFRRALWLKGGGKWCVVDKLEPVAKSEIEETQGQSTQPRQASARKTGSSLLTYLGQQAVFAQLGWQACRHASWDMAAAGVTALAAGALGVLRAAAAERTAAESAAALRAAVVGPAVWQLLGPLLAKSALAGTVEAIASALLTQLCARARLACRCRLSSFLLQRSLVGRKGGRLYCLLNHQLSDSLDRVLTDDVQALTAGVWKLISDVSRRTGDIVIFGRALWHAAALTGSEVKKCVTFAALFSADGPSLEEFVLGGRGLMWLLLSVAWMEFALAYFASGSGISGDSTAVRHQRSAENGLFAAHSRLRREAERVAFAHAEAQERSILEEAIHARASAQRHQRRWEVFWSIAQQVTTRFTSQHLIWSLCVARCAQKHGSLQRSSTSDATTALGDALYYLRYISAIIPPLGNALGGWGEFLERWHVTLAPAARVHRLVSDLIRSEQQTGSMSCCMEPPRAARRPSVAMVCSTPQAARDAGFRGCSTSGALVNVDLQAGTGHRKLTLGADVCVTVSSACRSQSNGAGEGLTHLNLDVGEGDGGLFICGPVGAGKSLVARALCGLRPATQGIVRPLPVGDTMYLAPWPHLAGETLIDHLTYPQPCRSEFSAEVTSRLETVMAAAEAAHLLDGLSGSVQASERWADSLSLDDRQRLAFARLLWHVPRFAVLDECTTALPRTVEANVLAACKLAGITLIITSRRPDLVHSCTQVLELSGGGGAGWRLDDRRGKAPAVAPKEPEADGQ